MGKTMRCLKHQRSAIFEQDRRGRLKYSREDWGGIDLPREPSLRLGADERFFERSSDTNPAESEKKQNRFLDFVSKAGNVSASKKKCHVLSEKDWKRPTKKQRAKPVPMNVRKLEIELIQRRLPRYPSHRHLSDPSFYPLASCELFETVPAKEEPRKEVSVVKVKNESVTTTKVESKCLGVEKEEETPETPEPKRVSFSKPVDEEKSTSTTEIGTEYMENDSDYYASTEFEEVECSEDENDYDMPEITEQSTEESSVMMEQDDTSAAYAESESYEDESYYSESEVLSEDEVSMEADDIFEQFLQLKRMQLHRVEKVDPESEADESIEMKRMQLHHFEKVDPEYEADESIEEIEDEESIEEFFEESISEVMRQSLSTIADESVEESTSHSTDELPRSIPQKSRPPKTIGFSTKYIPETRYASEDGVYLREVGFVPPLVRMMIFQARMELRCKKVTEEHKEEYKPTLAEAILLARATRLDEYIIETMGRNKVKYDDSEIPSVVWVKGKESVRLPKFKDPTPEQFQIFKEAVALGGIKALKPDITMNYDPMASITKCYDEWDLDVDDANRHKLIRTKYLTDMYLHDEWRAQSDDEDDEESVKYESLDDVELPTNDCPTYACEKRKLEEQELKDLIAQQVAEAVWERRYRLERPRAKQRIKYRCTCKYCKTSSTYQTFAYRKRWLVQQKLWNEPPVHDPNQEIIEVPLMDDAIEDTDLKKTSFRTESTVKLSVGDLSGANAKTGSRSEEAELSDGISVSTRSDSESPPAESFALEEFDFTANKMSPKISCTVVPAQPTPEGQKEQKKKTFMNRSSVRGLRSLFSK